MHNRSHRPSAAAVVAAGVGFVGYVVGFFVDIFGFVNVGFVGYVVGVVNVGVVNVGVVNVGFVNVGFVNVGVVVDIFGVVSLSPCESTMQERRSVRPGRGIMRAEQQRLL